MQKGTANPRESGKVEVTGIVWACVLHHTVHKGKLMQPLDQGEHHASY